ncbi:cupin domain-containing protein [Mesorhizobium sp. M0166]|uniref:cupin domain-containing protein n=1 Tax=Mesorhizobium sp. M0166 TaxID=2956902 RepID=UPI00333818DB
MRIVDTDPVARAMPSGVDPDYQTGNPIQRLMDVYEGFSFAAEREHYQRDLVQALLPVESITLYGPRPPNEQRLDPVEQDFIDFQKQNVCDFALGDIRLLRGWVTVEDWTGPFLQLSYRGGPDSRLSAAANHSLGGSIRLYLKVGDQSGAELLTVPYNTESDRYEVEIWSYPDNDLHAKLDMRGRAALDRAHLILRPDLVVGSAEDFRRESVEDKPMNLVSPGHAMHPILPVRIELAWSDMTGAFWDSRHGQNYVYEFSMIVRGWDNYLKVGGSSNPHGGLGRLEYRNLLSNYFEFQNSGELGRTPAPWNADAFGSKAHRGRPEPFLSVDYMDLHVIRPNAGIGLHRHRDNQEIFMVMENEVVMIVGDWCELTTRQRAFEMRTLPAGHFALLKPGQVHGLMNPTDEDIPLLMFGGYD